MTPPPPSRALIPRTRRLFSRLTGDLRRRARHRRLVRLDPPLSRGGSRKVSSRAPRAVLSFAHPPISKIVSFDPTKTQANHSVHTGACERARALPARFGLGFGVVGRVVTRERRATSKLSRFGFESRCPRARIGQRDQPPTLGKCCPGTHGCAGGKSRLRAVNPAPPPSPRRVPCGTCD